MADLTGPLVTEFVGTFMLLGVFFTLIAAPDASMPPGLVPLGVGLAMASAMYVGLGVSGANYNPAVSLMFYLKDGNFTRFAAYVFAQLAGAAAAMEFVKNFNPSYK